MNWDAVGALGEVVGSVAIIISIAYLSIQIRSNSKIALATSERELMNEWKELQATMARDPELIELFLKGLADYDDLILSEQARFGAICEQFVVYHLNAMRMHQKGLFETEMLESTDLALLSVLASDGGRQWWSEFGEMHPATHFNYVTKLLEEHDAGTGT